jgi:hypothetical protein
MGEEMSADPMNSSVCCEAFREAGFTGAACNFPLTAEGAVIIAQHNGIAVEQMPRSFFYAPNAYMQSWMNDLGARQARGETVRDGRRWLTPTELEAR